MPRPLNQGSVTVGDTPTVIVPSNGDRITLTLQTQTGSNTVFFRLDGANPTVDEDLFISPGGSSTLGPDEVGASAIVGVCDTGLSAVVAWKETYREG